MQDFIINRKKFLNIATYIIGICTLSPSFFYICKTWYINRAQFDITSTSMYIFLIMLLYFIIYLVHICIHEIGHLVIGYLCGYKFLSIRVLRYLIVKGKTYKVYNINKISSIGQCLMIKSNQESKLACVLYNIGGCIMNLITVAIVFSMIKNGIIKNHLVLYYIFCSVGLSIFIINAIPHSSNNVYSDGLNAFFFLKNKEMRITNHYQLLIYKELLLNARPSELSISKESAIYLKSNINIYSFYPLYMLYFKSLDEKDTDNAKDVIDILINNLNLFSDESKMIIRMENLYFRCLTKDEVILSEEEKLKINKLMENGSIEYIRIYHALCKWLFKDKDTARSYANAIKEISPIYMNGLFDFHRDMILKYEQEQDIV